jgi:transposase
MSTAAKNKAIKDTRKATKLRRKSLSCKVYSCKIDKSHLSKQAKEFLRMVFLEAKWFVNDIISSDSIFKSDYKKKTPTVLKEGKTPELRQIKYLSAQIRQALADNLQQDIFNLAKLKKTGRRVGRLKCKKEVKTLPLTQPNYVFKLVDKTHVHIQGNKGLIRIHGLSQIPKDAEIAQATLVHRAGDYFLKVTCFVPRKPRIKTGKSVGLDFGITTSVATSDGDKFKIAVTEPRRLRLLQRGKFVRQLVKTTKNRRKKIDLVAQAYDKVCRQKTDLQNKLVTMLTREYDLVACQDENITGWKGRFGRQVQQSCMGGIISDLKDKSETFILVSRWFPSTKTCRSCGNKQEILLSDRIFQCRVCGHSEDRDIHSAKNILQEAFRVMRDSEHVKSPVELVTPVLSHLGQSKSSAVKQEAIAL